MKRYSKERAGIELRELANAFLSTAFDDLNTAKYTFKGNHYLWTVFICQQAVEKALKAYIAEITGEMPPKKHDLMALAKRPA